MRALLSVTEGMHPSGMPESLYPSILTPVTEAIPPCLHGSSKSVALQARAHL